MGSAVVGHPDGARVTTTRAVRAHLLVLVALLLAFVAWRHWVSRYGLELPRATVPLPGGCKDLHVRLVWLRALVAATLASGAAMLVAALQRTLLPAAVVRSLIALIEIAGPGTLPSLGPAVPLVAPDPLGQAGPRGSARRATVSLTA